MHTHFRIRPIKGESKDSPLQDFDSHGSIQKREKTKRHWKSVFILLILLLYLSFVDDLDRSEAR